MPVTLYFDFVNDKSLTPMIGPAATCVRAGAGATYRNAAGVRVVAAANEARFDHDSSGNSLGLLHEKASENLFLNSDAPVTQNITTSAQDYTVSVEGSGTVTLSGTATGVASEGSPLTVTASAGTLTCTVAGGPDWVQVEAGNHHSSMIQTAGSAVTRAVDDITGIDLSFYNSGGPNSLFSHATPLYTVADEAGVFTIGSSATNLQSHGIHTTDGMARFESKVSGGNSALIYSGGRYVVGSATRIASRLELNDAKAYFNGVTSGVDTSCDYLTPSGEFSIGQEAGGRQWEGHIKEFACFDEALSDADLVALSDGSKTISEYMGSRNYLAVFRRTAKQMNVKQRMPKPRNTLRGKFE